MCQMGSGHNYPGDALGQHDVSYRTLFSHPHLVESLIRGFLPPEWVEGLDFETLVPVSEAHPTQDWRLRYNDCVWRLRRRVDGRWLFLYLMLEFQRRHEHFMAARILSYEGVLYEHLLRALGLKSGDKLPVVLPVVLYNGREVWTAKKDIFDLIEPAPPSMSDYLPRLRYKLIDIRRLPLAELKMMHNAVAGLFRLEANHRLEPSLAAVDDLDGILDPQDHAAIRHDVTRWICEVLLPSRMSGATVQGARKLEEVSSMITENAWDWTAEWKMKGLEEGRKEGRKEGERALLRRQLQRRFGRLDPSVEKRLQSAGAEQLLEWGERFVTAESLAEVFAGEQ